MVNLFLCMAGELVGGTGERLAALRRGYGARRKPDRSSLRADAYLRAGKGSSMAFAASELAPRAETQPDAGNASSLAFAASELAVTQSST